MLLLLSSGARPRYLDDVTRAIGQPSGSSLQFRYQSKWLDEKVSEKLSKGLLEDEKAIIAYLDRSDKTEIPTIVPCRVGTIKTAKKIGSTIVVNLSLDGFAIPDNPSTFQQNLRSISHSQLPEWKNNSLVGKYFLELEQHFCNFESHLDLEAWEGTVNSLCKHSEILKNGPSVFFYIRGIYPTGGETPIPFDKKKNSFGLNAGSDYELRVYHYHASSEPSTEWLSVLPTNNCIELLSNPSTPIDSRYDEKVFRFKTLKDISHKASVLIIKYIDTGSPSDSGRFEFEVPTRINGEYFIGVIQSLIIGICVATPGVIALVAAGKESFWTVSGSLALGIIAGITSVFGWKKSV